MVFMIVIAALTALLTGCAAVKASSACPETSGMKCMSKPECSYDYKRGCNVCSCGSPWVTDPVGPDGRVPGSQENEALKWR